MAHTPFIIPSFHSWNVGGTKLTASPLRAVKARLGVTLIDATSSPAVDVHVIFRKDGHYFYSVTLRDAIMAGERVLTSSNEMLGPLPSASMGKIIGQDFGIALIRYFWRSARFRTTQCLRYFETSRLSQNF